MTLLEDLRWRGLVADCTDEAELTRRLAAGPLTLYCGFDPTSDSLHVGNLVPLLALRRFQEAGHHPIALAGGATGMIGDPSGKSAERNLQTPEQVAHNLHSIKGQLHRLLDFKTRQNPARSVDNASWTAPLTYLEFLRDVGKHFTVNWMVAKESVRARMEDRENGISYTEFSYMLLQAYDFYHLHQALGCELQIGATDQWGNITAGTELIRRKTGKPAHGLVMPLLTKADGTKYGKTASGAVWLDPKKTSPYRFYQFFVQADDADVVKLLKTLTFLSREEITALEAGMKNDPGARAAQKALARELTTLVHGEMECFDAIGASNILFGGDPRTVSEATFTDLLWEIDSLGFNKAALIGTSLTEILAHEKLRLSQSKGQARKDIEGGGIYVNNVRVNDVTRTITADDFLFGKYVLLRKGKKTYAVLNAPN
ncbi:MAG TPA: tyrosine--tRNA ligase [Opitutaceae bacterium]|jgi:tyrosyl-tRNA synthetase|nr:tyrosine--tRNA ligase [Opitutaceae bacterium]